MQRSTTGWQQSCLTGLFALAILSGCARPIPVEPNLVRFGTGTPIQSFDPHRADAGPMFSTYLTLAYDGLTTFNPDSLWDPVPGLARSWTWLDERTIEFYLVENARFIDGEPFDAEAARANIGRMLAARGPRVNTVATIKEAVVVDQFTLRLYLHSPDPTLLQNLASSPGMMISPAAFDNTDLDLNPVGTGPWMYDRANSALGEKHRFIPNPDYFNPDLDNRIIWQIHVLSNARARLNALISGQIDLAILGAKEAQPAAEQGFAVARRASRWFGMTLLDRNGELVPELADVRVRQALGFAVDRQAIADVVFFGYARPGSQPMVDGLGYVADLDDFYSYNPERARQLLREAGAEGFEFTIPVLPDDSAEYEAVQGYLRDVGINMEIKVIEPGTIGALARTRKYPVNSIGYPNYDPDSRHPAIWETTAAFNPFQVRGVLTDALAEEARSTLDEDVRQERYKRYFETVVKDVYSLVYLQIEDLVAYDDSRLEYVPMSRYIDPRIRNIRLRSNNVISAQAVQ